MNDDARKIERLKSAVACLEAQTAALATIIRMLVASHPHAPQVANAVRLHLAFISASPPASGMSAVTTAIMQDMGERLLPDPVPTSGQTRR